MKKLILIAVMSACAYAQTTDYIQQVRNKPSFDPREYNWSRTSGIGVSGSLASTGSNTLTLTPCPKGITASAASQESVYISGGTGTAEAAYVTGGTCTSGKLAGGTFVVFTSNTHTGAWTVRSATSGIQEALYAADGALVSQTYGVVRLGYGDYPAYQRIALLNGIGIIGEGAGSSSISIQGTGIGLGIDANRETILADLTVRYLDGVSGYAAGTSPLIQLTTGSPAVAQTTFLYIRGVRVMKGYDCLQAAASGYAVLATDLTMDCSHSDLSFPAGTNANPNVFNGENINMFGPATAKALDASGALNGFFLNNFSATAGLGMVFAAGSGNSINNAHITNGSVNTQATASGNGIDIAGDAATTSDEFQISNVRLVAAGTSGVGLKVTNKANMQVSNCYLFGSQTGLFLSTATNGKYTNNHISSNASNAITFQTTSNANVFTGNVVGFSEQGATGASSTTSAAAISTDGTAHSNNVFDSNKFNPINTVVINWGSGVGNWYKPGQVGLNIPAVASASTLPFPPAPFFTVTGTTGVTAVSGLVQGQYGKLLTTAGAVVFTAGATVGNTYTTVQNSPVDYFFDGTKVYLNGTGSGTGGSVTMGGDVTGSSGTSTVVKAQGNPLQSGVPTEGQVYSYDVANTRFSLRSPAASPLTRATVSFSATPVFDVTSGQVLSITLTGDTTSSSITNPQTGSVLYIRVVQDATGGRVFIFPPDLLVDPSYSVDTGANRVTILPLQYTGTKWEFFAAPQSFPTV